MGSTIEMASVTRRLEITKVHNAIPSTARKLHGTVSRNQEIRIRGGSGSKRAVGILFRGGYRCVRGDDRTQGTREGGDRGQFIHHVNWQ